ncbi:terminase small subunit [Parahaliea mediterranea]|uniref:terminase small subunit n=1 Tax=Parahaliea mediterranea TaxID=651086 RepID=UPI000E2EB007|nr:terminase small subunit [Parahaliea mediterranea]
MSVKLTAKQEQFCHEYLVDLNATQAAARAGYSKKTAKDMGCQNLAKPNIAERIEALKAERMERIQISADYVLQRLVEIDQMDIAEILNDDFSVKPLREWPETWRRTLSGVDVSEYWEGSGEGREMTALLKKIKWPDKLRNLELIGRHVAVGAFREVIDHNHRGEVKTITRRIVDAAGGTG